MFLHEPRYFFTPANWSDLNGTLDRLPVNQFSIAVVLYSEDSVFLLQNTAHTSSPYFFEIPYGPVFSSETMHQAAQRILWIQAKTFPIQIKGVLTHFDYQKDTISTLTRVIVLWGVLGKKMSFPLSVSAKFSHGSLVSQREIADYALLPPFRSILDLFWFGGGMSPAMASILLKDPEGGETVSIALLFRKPQSNEIFLVPSQDGNLWDLVKLPAHYFVEPFVLHEVIQKHWGISNCCESAFLGMVTIFGVNTAIFVAIDGGNCDWLSDHFHGFFSSSRELIYGNLHLLSPLARWACMAFNERFAVCVDYSIREEKPAPNCFYS